MTETVLSEAGLHLQGMAELLRTKLFQVPVYQRSYSWGPQQVLAFWNDLRTSLVTDAGDYFMGTVFLANDQERATVIDGQQRLATLSILLGCIRDTYLEHGDTARAQGIQDTFLAHFDLRTATQVPRLIMNTTDSTFFADTILGGSNEAEPQVFSHRRIRGARAVLAQQLADDLETVGRQWPERLVGWVDYLTRRVKVISIEVANDADAFMIFETINDRALDLTVADLLKNYLLSLAVSDSPADGPDVESTWLSMVAAFDAEAEDDARTTTFIRQFWSSSHGPVREKDLYSHLKRRVKTGEAARTVIHDLAVSAPTYAALSDSTHPRWRDLGVPHGAADTLVRLGLTQPRPLTLAALETMSGPALEQLLHAIICWQVRGLIVGNIGGGTTERAYAHAAAAVRRGVTDPGAVARELAQVIPSDGEFTSTFATKAVSQSKLARYYLAAFEAHLNQRALPALISNQQEGEFALTYIMPRNTRRDDPAWEELPEAQRARWALRLGNQTLLEDPSQARRAAVADTIANSKLLLNARLRADDWTPSDIEDRQSWFSGMAREIWPAGPEE